MNNHDTRPSNATEVLIGQQIRVARKTARMTQGELAASLKLSAQQIQKYESGHNRISAGTLYHVAKAVGQPVSFFYELKPHLSSKEEANQLRVALAKKLVAIDNTAQLSVLLNVARVFR